MTVTNKLLIPRKFAENVDTAQYTAPTVIATLLDKMTATNNSGSNVTISVHLVAAGGTAISNNRVVNARIIAPGETYTFPELSGQVLLAGGFISTVASAASALTISAAGREIT